MKTQAELYPDIQTILANGWEQAAISALEQLLAAHPAFGQAHYDLAVLSNKTGQSDKCLKHFKKAVECEPENGDFLKSLADYYFGVQENAEEALPFYKRFLELRPEDPEGRGRGLPHPLPLRHALQPFQSSYKRRPRIPANQSGMVRAHPSEDCTGTESNETGQTLAG